MCAAVIRLAIQRPIKRVRLHLLYDFEPLLVCVESVQPVIKSVISVLDIVKTSVVFPCCSSNEYLTCV